MILWLTLIWELPNVIKKMSFYTSLSDIEQEMVHYRDYFEDKTIFMNCDDPEWSNFWIYFEMNFNFLGLKRLISTHYVADGSEKAFALVLERQEHNYPKLTKTNLKQNGDFRSEEAVAYLKKSDIVITNPPFSLWREYLAQLVEYEKDFIILGNVNAITYKEGSELTFAFQIWVYIIYIILFLGLFFKGILLI